VRVNERGKVTRELAQSQTRIGVADAGGWEVTFAFVEPGTYVVIARALGCGQVYAEVEAGPPQVGIVININLVTPNASYIHGSGSVAHAGNLVNCSLVPIYSDGSQRGQPQSMYATNVGPNSWTVHFTPPLPGGMYKDWYCLEATAASEGTASEAVQVVGQQELWTPIGR
jgi:hypothetical protein